MSSTDRKEKAARIRQLMEEEGEAVGQNTRGFNRGRYESVGRLENYAQLKDRARSIKERAIDALPQLIEEVRYSVEANGGHVHLAEDAEHANRIIRDVTRKKGAEVVAKSKSMTTEEIEVNEHLESRGVEVWETDLGEFVLQVADEAPSHIVAPAIHKSREKIAALFNRYFELDPPLESARELTEFARQELHKHIRKADVGMTGANFIVAETGTLALVTSEGNARKSVACADTHVAVAGVEKIIPNFEDLQPFIELIGRSGTGQDLTSYLSLFTPPSSTPTLNFDQPDRRLGEDSARREFHLILLDNGRMAMREDDPLRETLYCIRCGACANSCANFQSVGGHAFGGKTYSGGIATGWEAGIYGEETTAEFNDFCTGCSRCVNQCPVNIDIPWINNVVRDRVNRGSDAGEFDFLVSGLTPDEEPGGLDWQKRFFGNFDLLAKWGSALAPVSNWLAGTRLFRALMEHAVGLDRRRPIPNFRRETLNRWFQARNGPPGQSASREVVVFADLYTNHARVERGRAAVRVLEELGCRVRLTEPMESGRGPLSQGMIATARRRATQVHQALEPHLEAGRDVVVIEPSDFAMFHRDYEKLLPESSFQRLRERSFEVVEYVRDRVGEEAVSNDLQRGNGERLAYHSHCQQRTTGREVPTRELLEELGYELVVSEVECCGMAGSFGYKTEYYDLSMDVGQHLAEQLQPDRVGERTLVASGTSCMEQIESIMQRPVLHPLQLIDPGRNRAEEI